jgi:hypothetical protein
MIFFFHPFPSSIGLRPKAKYYYPNLPLKKAINLLDIHKLIKIHTYGIFDILKQQFTTLLLKVIEKGVNIRFRQRLCAPNLKAIYIIIY